VTSPDGMVVSFIHSLFNEFGARELVPGTGIVLNDRLANLRPGEGANSLRAGKRPMHTLHCYMVDRADGSTLSGSTPGGRGQVQTNLQVLVDVLDRGNELQSAVSRPRWVNGMPRRSPDDATLYLESALADQAAALSGRGHVVEIVAPHLDDHFGNCTLVGRSADNQHHQAAADERRAGHAQVW
jgi:gamma-glutamyltranspeptidase